MRVEQVLWFAALRSFEKGDERTNDFKKYRISPVKTGQLQVKQGKNTGKKTDGKQAAPRKNTGKKQAIGRFVKGQSGNPKGRPKGSLNKRNQTRRGFLEGSAEALATTAIIDALSGGDSPFLKYCLQRSLPASKDAIVIFDLPPITNIADLAKAQISVIRSVAEGKLTPIEGQNVCAIADKILKTLKEQKAEASSCEC
jgi:hypothetical protein